MRGGMLNGAILKMLAITIALGVSMQARAVDSGQPLTRDAAQVLDWVVKSRDNHGLPFMILDKKQAHLWVYDRAAQLKGDAPVLLGSARGDHTLPGIGAMRLADIKPADRTTPAGRFVAETGVNERRESVVWVDYDAGVSMHPVLTTNAKEQRQHRLETPTPADNRISFGCINVPTAFHQQVVLGTAAGGRTVVYILPDSSPLTSVFTQLAPHAAPRSTVATQ